MTSKTTHITPVGGNVFADLGFQPDETAKLKAHSDMIIRTKLQLAERQRMDKEQNLETGTGGRNL